MKERLATFDLGDAGFEAAPPLKGRPGTLGLGSRNIIPISKLYRRAWKGLLEADTQLGARVMFNAGGKIAGLDDISDTEAMGSVDLYLRSTLWFMGFGQLIYDGAEIPGAVASTTQKVLARVNGSFTHANSGPFDAGLPQPSRPEVRLKDTPTSGFRGRITGSTSFMVASIRHATGDRSRASYASITLFGNNSTVVLTFPQAPVGGDAWAVFAPRLGFGGVGVHRRIRNANRLANREYLESDIERSVTDVVTTDASTTITSATASFTSADIGKHVSLVKGMSTHTSTIANVLNATTAVLASAVPFTETDVTGTFTAYADGILRSVEIEYDDTDLTPEAAWIADFPPLPGVASFPLVDVRVVCGILSDAVSDPTVGDAGTALSVSEKGHPGSYDPEKLLFIPEGYVGSVGRAIDRHFFIFSKNWLGAVQYTGADLGPAATISTVWADTGFARQQAVCLAYGRLYGFSTKGEAVRLQNTEEPDSRFAEDVQYVFDDWNPEKVVVVPFKNAVLYCHEGQALLFNLQTEKWLPPCYLSDFADGRAASGISIDGATYIAMDDDGDITLYEFDAGAGSVAAFVTNYVGTPAAHRKKTLLEVAETVITDTSDDYLITLHRNGKRISIDDAEMAANDNILVSASAKFTAGDEGLFVLVFDALNGGGTLLARIGRVTSPTTAELVIPVRPLSSTAINTEQAVTNGHVIFADLVITRNAGTIHAKGRRINLRNCYSYAVGLVLNSIGDRAQAVQVTVLGSVKTDRAGGEA